MPYRYCLVSRERCHMMSCDVIDSFQKQNEAYINQLATPTFSTWLTDAVEKEKMKQKHLRGVIEHLESEVSSLSLETINSMKQSMLKLGITNLTPEGLLCGAKDIVSLNRQLRKEVQLLEKEVNQLKIQNNLMYTVGTDQPNHHHSQLISVSLSSHGVICECPLIVYIIMSTEKFT